MAGRRCSVCGHAERDAIDCAIIAGDGVAAIARHFAVSQDAISRHRDAHLPRAAIQEGAQAVAEAEGLRGASLLDQAAGLRDTAVSLLRSAERAGDLRTALGGVREARGCLELMAKLTGDLDASTTVSLTFAPQFLTVQTAILAALSPYPDARRAVVLALESVT